MGFRRVRTWLRISVRGTNRTIGEVAVDQQTIERASADIAPTTSFGRSIRLFLADGTPQGMVIADVMNWTG
jgi:hypothetical protein